MIDHADNIIDLNAIFHPGSVYGIPAILWRISRYRSPRSARSSQPGRRMLLPSHRILR